MIWNHNFAHSSRNQIRQKCQGQMLLHGCHLSEQTPYSLGESRRRVRLLYEFASLDHFDLAQNEIFLAYQS